MSKVRVSELKRKYGVDPSLSSRTSDGDTGFSDLKSIDKGLVRGLDQNRQRNIAQNNWKAIGNAALQGLVGIVGGTLEGVGYLGEIPNMIAQGGIDEDNFSNWFINAGKSINEWGEEIAPTYIDPQNTQGFNPGNGEWWAANIPSIFSTLSLMIPSTGVAKLASAGGKFLGRGTKAMRAIRKGLREANLPIDKTIPKLLANSDLPDDLRKNLEALQKVNNNIKFAEGVTAAITSRHMENMMESSETFQSTYDQALADGMSEEEAQQAAGIAASKNYRDGYAAMVTDVPQYLGALGFKLPFLKKGALTSKTGKKVIDYPVNALKATLIDSGMGSEAFEEAMQYVIAKEAERKGLGIEDGTTYGERLQEYLTDPELQTSAFFGALGGGLFAGAGKLIEMATSDNPKLTAQMQKVEESVKEGNGEKIKDEVETISQDAEVVEENPNVQQEADNLKEAIDVAQATVESLPTDNEAREDIGILSGNMTLLDKEINNLQSNIDETISKQSQNQDHLRFLLLKEKLKSYKGSKKTSPQRIKETEQEIERLKEVVKDQPKNGDKSPAFFNLKKAVIDQAKYEIQLDDFQTQREKLNTKEGRQEVKQEQEKKQKKAENKYFEAFSNAVEQASTPDDVRSVLQEYNEKLSDEQLEKAANKAKEQIDKKAAEEKKEFKSLDKSVEDVDYYSKKYEGRPFLAEKDLAKVKAKAPDNTNVQNLTVDTLGAYLDSINPKVEKEETTSTQEELDEQSAMDAARDRMLQEEADETQSTEQELDETSESGEADFFEEEEIEENTRTPEYEEEPVIESYNKGDRQGESTQIPLDEVDTEVDQSENGMHVQVPEMVVFKTLEDGSVLIGNKPKDFHGIQGNVVTAESLEKAGYKVYNTNGGWKVLETKQGDPVTSGYEDLIDFQAANDVPVSAEGEQVQFVVYDTEFNRGDITLVTADNIEIHVVHNDKVIGKLKALSNKLLPESREQLRKIREEAFAAYQSGLTGQALTTKGKINHVLRGYFWNTSNIRNISGTETLAVGKTTGGAAVTLQSNEGNPMHDNVSKSYRSGAVYHIVEVAPGEFRPYRVFTKKVSEASLPNIPESIEKFYPIFYKYAYDRYSTQEEIPLTDVLFELLNMVNSEQFNDQNFVNDLRKEIRSIVTFKDSKGNIHPDFRQNIREIKTYQENGMFSPIKFMEVHKLTDKTAQVKATDVNSSGYNELIAPRLQTDINPGQKLHSRKFLLEIEKDEPTFSEETEKKSETKRNVEKRSVLRIRNLNKKLYRLANLKEYKKWNEKEELRNFKKMFPNIPISVLPDLKKIYGKRAWGVFTNAGVAIDKNAAEGTTYHEAFHVAFTLAANEAQREKLLKQYRKQYPNLSDRALEEAMADDFMEYYMTEYVNPSLGTRIKRFFRKLLNMIKLAVNYPLSTRQFFYHTASGGFSNTVLTNEAFADRFKIEEYTPEEIKRRVDNLMRIIDLNVLNLYPKGTSIEEGLTDLLRRGFMKDGFIITEDGKQYEVSMISELEVQREYVPEDQLERYDQFVQDYKDGKFDDFVYRSFIKYGIKIKGGSAKKAAYASSEDSKNLYVDTEQETLESWQGVATSTKENLTTRLIRAFRNIPVTEEVDGEFVEVVDDFGFPVYYEADQVYATLQEFLGESVSVVDMIKRAKELGYRDIRNFLVPLLESSEKLQTDLYYQLAQNIKPTVLTTIRRSGGYRSINADAVTLENAIIGEFKTGFKPNDKSIQALRKNPKTAKELDKALRYSGIKLNKAALENLYSEGNKNDINSFITKMKDIIVDEVADQSHGKKAAKIIKKFYPKSFQSAHLNVEGEKVYGWMRSNYAGRAINQLKRGLFDTAIYENDPLISNMPLFKEYKKNNGLKNIDFTISEGIKHSQTGSGTKYSNMTESDVLLTMLSNFMNNSGGNNRVYNLPILSDAPTFTGIRLTLPDRFNDKVNQLQGIAQAEFVKVEKAKDELESFKSTLRQELEKQGVDSSKINKIVDKGVKSYSNRVEKRHLFPYVSSEQTIRKDILAEIDRQTDELYNYLESIGVIYDEKGTIKTKIDLNKKGETVIKNFLKDFITSYKLANVQMIPLMFGDPAFYKNIPDFFKRTKQIWSPGNFVNTRAIGREDYNVVFLPDEEFPSPNLKVLEEALEGSPRKDQILASYKANVNETDAQSLIDMYSYRDRMVGRNQWTEEDQQAYDAIMSGKNLEDTSLDLPKKVKERVYQTLKPFYYNQHILPGTNVVSPMQNKDSESLMLPFHANPLLKDDTTPNPIYNPEYKRMMEQMGYSFSGQGSTFTVSFDEQGRKESKYVDKFSFESGIKAGLFGVAVKNEDGNIDYNSGYRHKFSYDAYRFQVETPEHHIDSDVLFATQIQKLITGDLNLEETYTIGENEMTGKQLVEYYNRLLVRDIIRSSNELKKRFTNEDGDFNYEQFIEMLREEAVDRGLGEQFLYALELKPSKKETKLPLFHPLHAQNVERLVTSIFRNNITRQKFDRGVTLINKSSFGFSRKPKIIKSDDGGITLEAYVAPYSDELYKFANDDGIIDVEKVRKYNPKLLEGVVYRIPTEDKYSMFNIKIIGFLPREEGGSIVLPPEVTTIAGLDFDIDKVFGFFYQDDKKIGTKEHKINYGWDSKVAKEYKEKINKLKRSKQFIKDKYDNVAYEDAFRERELKYMITVETNEEAKQDLIKELNEVSRFVTDQEREELNERKKLLAIFRKEIDNLYEERDEIMMNNAEEKGYESHIEKLTSDNNKLDVINNILKSKHTVEQFLKPGSFDRMKANNRIIRFKNIESPGISLEEFEKMSPKEQEDFIDSNEGQNADLASPKYNALIAQRMNVGKALVGIAANNNAIHPILQQFNISLDWPVKFNNYDYTDLSAIYEISPELTTEALSRVSTLDNFLKSKGASRITENISENLAAFVDNGKDPQAEFFNMNLTTAGVGFLLLHTGVDLKTMQYFLAQPILKSYVAQRNLGKSQEKAIEAITGQPFSMYDVNVDKEGNISHNIKSFSTTDLLDNLEQPSDQYQGDFQRDVLTAFVWYDTLAQQFGAVVKAARAGDDGMQTSWPNVASVINHVDKTKGKLQNYHISGANDLLNSTTNYLIEKYKTGIKDAYQYAVDNMGMPDLTKGEFGAILDKLTSYKGDSLNESEINLAYREYIRFISSNVKFYSSDQFHYLMYRFPERFAKMDLPDNEFAQRLQVKDGVIKFNGVIGNDAVEMDNLRFEWARLLDQNRELAMNLAKYSFFVSGFSYSLEGFSNLMPVEIYETHELQMYNNYIKHYIESQKNISKNYAKESELIDIFIEQFFVNNYEKISYISTISENEIEFVKSNGEIIEAKPKINNQGQEVFLPVRFKAYFKGNQYYFYKRADDHWEKPISNRFEIKVKRGQREYIKKIAHAYNTNGTIGFSLPQPEVNTKIDLFEDAIVESETVSVEQYYEGNITPDKNTIFVFGSNPEGRHDTGAAKIAKDKFGAKYGQGEGLQGNAYALPTKNIRKLITAKGTINVYWGQAESAKSTRILSNLAPRKFTWEGREYGSVEHAYQSNKSGNFDQDTYNKYVKVGGYGRKIRGKGVFAKTKGANILEMMKRLVIESFRQNPNSEAAKKLLQYENFTHNTNKLIDKAFLEGLKLAQKELNSTSAESISPQQITQSIKKLYATAKQNPDKQFKVAYRNTTEKSLNGYTGLEMIDMFNNAGTIPSNVIFSKEWFDTGKLNIQSTQSSFPFSKEVPDVDDRIKYKLPSNIEINNTSVPTNVLEDLADNPVDDFINQFSFVDTKNNYGDLAYKYHKKIGEITNAEAEFLKNSPYAKVVFDKFMSDEKAEGITLTTYIPMLLDEYKIIIDENQLSLFDEDNPLTDECNN